MGSGEGAGQASWVTSIWHSQTQGSGGSDRHPLPRRNASRIPTKIEQPCFSPSVIAPAYAISVTSDQPSEAVPTSIVLGSAALIAGSWSITTTSFTPAWWTAVTIAALPG